MAAAGAGAARNVTEWTTFGHVPQFAPCQRVKWTDMHQTLGGRRAVRVVLAGLLLAASAGACDSSSGGARSSASNTVAT